MRWWWRWERLLRTVWWNLWWLRWQWIWQMMQKNMLRFITESWSLHLKGKQISPRSIHSRYFSPNRFWWIFAFVAWKFPAALLFSIQKRSVFWKKSAQSSITQKPLCFNLVIRKQLTITTKNLCHLNQEPPVAEPGAKRTGREKRLHPLGWWSWWPVCM